MKTRNFGASSFPFRLFFRKVCPGFRFFHCCSCIRKNRKRKKQQQLASGVFHHLFLCLTVVAGNWIDNPRLSEFCRARGQQNLLAAIQSGEIIPGDALGPNHSFKPGFMWDAGIRPLIPFAIRGVIWYQGESNAETSARPIATSTAVYSLPCPSKTLMPAPGLSRSTCLIWCAVCPPSRPWDRYPLSVPTRPAR